MIKKQNKTKQEIMLLSVKKFQYLPVFPLNTLFSLYFASMKFCNFRDVGKIVKSKNPQKLSN